jgi:ADP-ribose pyrophosphatase YjhB (NUDIX family)
VIHSFFPLFDNVFHFLADARSGLLKPLPKRARVAALAALLVERAGGAMSPRLQDLQSFLAQFSASDAEEAAHLRHMRQLCGAASDPCARDHFVPGHFTASAFILSPERDALLLIFHGKLARWLQPGGHVDPGDADLLASARREAAEEVSLHDLELLSPAPFDLDVHDIPPLRGEPAHQHFDVRYLFRAPARVMRAASDAKAARWVPLSEVSLEISDRSVLRAVEKLRR